VREALHSWRAKQPGALRWGLQQQPCGWLQAPLCIVLTWCLTRCLKAMYALQTSTTTALHRAVEGDDWSSVIDGQTSETVAPALVDAQLRAARNPIATPFARASVHRSIGAAARRARPCRVHAPAVRHCLHRLRQPLCGALSARACAQPRGRVRSPSQPA